MLDDDVVAQVAVEDGPVEYGGALAWLVASVVCVVAWVRARRRGRARGIPWLLLLGFLFFFAGGEEVSWGQRLMGFETPEAVGGQNVQGEFNLHNLEVFHATDLDGEHKAGLADWLTMEKMFALFWLSFCVLLPLGVASVRPLSRMVRRLRTPVVPIVIGLLFPLNYAIHRALEWVQSDRPQLAWPNSEVKESVFALLFLLVAVYFLVHAARTEEASDDDVASLRFDATRGDE